MPQTDRMSNLVNNDGRAGLFSKLDVLTPTTSSDFRLAVAGDTVVFDELDEIALTVVRFECQVRSRIPFLDRFLDGVFEFRRNVWIDLVGNDAARPSIPITAANTMSGFLG